MNAAVYRWIIEDVVKEMRGEFQGEGLEESVLDELRKRWTLKLLESGLVGDQDPQQQQQQGVVKQEPGPLQQQEPGSLQQQQQQQQQGVVKQEPGHPQAVDGSAGLAQSGSTVSLTGLKRAHSALGFDTGSPSGTQGADTGGEEDGGVGSGGESAGEVRAALEKQDVTDVDLREELVSADDSSEEEEGTAFGEIEGQRNLMLCCTKKIKRTRNKWALVFSDGVLKVNGREVLIKEAVGELTW